MVEGKEIVSLLLNGDNHNSELFTKSCHQNFAQTKKKAALSHNCSAVGADTYDQKTFR